MALSRKWLWLLSVCIVLAAKPSDTLSPVLPAVVAAVGKIVTYYQRNYQELNLDGLFGLRVLEGQLLVLSQQLANGELQHIPHDLVAAISHYRLIASETSHMAIESVKKDDIEYYNSMAYVVAYPWTFHNRHKKLDTSLRWDSKTYRMSMNSELSESTSDMCMGELTGNVQKKVKKCQITRKCVGVMTEKGLTHYGITHQLLWTMLGEKAGCRPQLEKALRGTEFKTLDRLRQEFCTNNFFEMKELVHEFLNGTVTPKYQDLFLEQQFVCPNLGYGSFLSLEYLQAILSWQKELGCFGKMPKVDNPVYGKVEKFSGLKDRLDKDYDYEDSVDLLQQNLMEDGANVVEMEQSNQQGNYVVENGIKVLKNSPGNIHFRRPVPKHSHDTKRPFKVKNKTVKKQNENAGKRKLLAAEEERMSLFRNRKHHHTYVVKNRPGRRLLVEKDMTGGCLSHKTAVAAGAMSMYLRYLLDPGDTGLDKGSIKLVDPGKKRDILQQNLAHGQQGNEQLVKDLDKIDPYQTELEDEGDGEDEYEDGAEDGHEDGEEYRDVGEAKLAGRNIIHMKRLENGDKDSDVYDVGKVPKLDTDNEQEEYKGDNQHNEDEEYPYYDETEEDKKLKIKDKRIKPLPAELKHEKTAQHGKPETSARSVRTLSKEIGAERAMVLIFLACFVVLFLFMFRFIKKRRIHIRYHVRTFFKL